LSNGGAGPKLPEWHTIHQDALRRWLETNPPLGWITDVTEWIRGCQLLGPPQKARALDGDRFVCPIPNTKVKVEYLVIDYEYLIIVKNFG